MRNIILLQLTLVLAFGLVSRVDSTSRLVEGLTIGQFEDFMNEEYGKTYDRSSEAELRFAIFQNNLDKIIQHNVEYFSGLHSYWCKFSNNIHRMGTASLTFLFVVNL